MRCVVVLCWTVLLLTLLATVDGCGRSATPPAKPAAPAAAPTEGAVPAATAGETWTCPMHPEVKAAAPGKCPVCKMDLVPAKPAAAEKAAAPSGEAR